MDQKTLAVLVASGLLAGCGASSTWMPWSKNTTENLSRTPPGAKAYACEGKKRLLVRFQQDSSAWVIYPDREFRLDKVTAASDERYSNTVSTLVVKGNEATLTEGGKIEFDNCKLEANP